MENVMTTAFVELSANEMLTIDGGKDKDDHSGVKDALYLTGAAVALAWTPIAAIGTGGPGGLATLTLAASLFCNFLS